MTICGNSLILLLGSFALPLSASVKKLSSGRLQVPYFTGRVQTRGTTEGERFEEI
jgi:hypothetical protein